MSKNFNIRLESLKTMRATYFHAFSDKSEEDAWKKAEEWLNEKGLLENLSKIRIFGRNTYPTENPEPHGYGYFITITPEFDVKKEGYVRFIPGGLYAVVRCEGFEQMQLAWSELWKWVGKTEYKYIGETKGEHGFELGFEEHINWHSTLIDKSQKQFVFDLMLQLWEE